MDRPSITPAASVATISPEEAQAQMATARLFASSILDKVDQHLSSSLQRPSTTTTVTPSSAQGGGTNSVASSVRGTAPAVTTVATTAPPVDEVVAIASSAPPPAWETLSQDDHDYYSVAAAAESRHSITTTAPPSFNPGYKATAAPLASTSSMLRSSVAGTVAQKMPVAKAIPQDRTSKSSSVAIIASYQPTIVSIPSKPLKKENSAVATQEMLPRCYSVASQAAASATPTFDKAREMEYYNAYQNRKNDETVMATAIPDPNNTPLFSQAPLSGEDSMTKPPAKKKPDFVKMKERRKSVQMAAGVAGTAIGLVAIGPVAAVVCGLAGNKVTKAVAKRRENRIKKEYAEREQQQDFAPHQAGVSTF